MAASEEFSAPAPSQLSRSKPGLPGAAVLAVVLLVAGLAALHFRPAGSRRAPGTLAAAPTSVNRQHGSRVAGFDQVAFAVERVPPTRAHRIGCALLADTTARQEQGLMGRRDLDGYDAMVFQFAGDTTVGFYNKDVPIALSIAWFDGAGAFIAQADMAVCSAVCPTVAPSASFRYAVEVPEGGLAHIGIGPASVLRVGGGC